MKKLSLLIMLLALIFAGNSVYAQFTQTQMVHEWQRAKVYTKEYLDAMPADGYSFKPTPGIRSFAQQMLHLTDGNNYFATSGSGVVTPPEKASAEKNIPPTKEAVTKAVMDSYDFVISTLQGLTPAQLQENSKVEGHEITKANIYGKAFEHQTHHRGQTTIYLRLKGITPPPEKLF